MKYRVDTQLGGLEAMLQAVGGRGGGGRGGTVATSAGGASGGSSGGGGGGFGDGGLRGPEMDRVRKQWSGFYAAFVQKRFDAYSKGRGDWAPLAVSTVKARPGPDARRARNRKRNGVSTPITFARDTRRGSEIAIVAGRTVSILRSTGVLFRALRIGAVGNYNSPTSRGIEFGFAGAPHGRAGDKATIAQIAGYHHTGGQHLPKRAILAPPDAVHAGLMSKALLAAVLAVALRGARR